MKKLVTLTVAVLTGAMLIGCLAGCAAKKETATDSPKEEAVSADVQVEEEDYEAYYASLPQKEDYVGAKFESEDSTFVDFKEDGSVEVSIFRLCSMEGTANWVDGGMELDLTDPSEEVMNAVFFPAGDGTYTLKITLSTWEYLPVEETLTGFTK